MRQESAETFLGKMCVCVVVSAVSDGSTDDMVDMEEIPAASIHRWTNTITYYCSI